jgi:hypothetical protein
MRYLNSEPAGGDVYLSSMAPTSVDRAYHRILEGIKGRRITPPFWGSVGSHRSVGKMIVKPEGGLRGVWLTTIRAKKDYRTIPIFHCDAGY